MMLGFRGELREQPEKLHRWVSDVKVRLARIRGQDWPYALEVEPRTNVPPLAARAQFQWMVLTVSAVVLLLIPVVSFFIIYHFGQ